MVLGEGVELERDGLRRLQQLDRQYFPPSSAQGNERPLRGNGEEHPIQTAPLQLPPLTSSGHRGGRGQKQSLSSSYQKPSTAGPLSSGDRGNGNNRRKANFNNSYSYGTNPNNPFEAVREAEPAIGSLGSKDWRLLDLVMPLESSLASMDDLGSDLNTFITENLKQNGLRTDTSPGRTHSPLRSSWRPTNTVSSLSGAPMSMRSSVSTTPTPGSQAQLHQHYLSGLDPSSTPTSTMRQPGSPMRMGTAAEGAGGGAYAPTLAWGDGMEVGSGVDPNSPHGANLKMNGAKPSPLRPPVGSAWTNTGTPGKAPLTAGGQQTALSFDRINGVMSPAAAEPVSLGQMLNETSSSRRQVQLMSSWLDAAMDHVAGRVGAQMDHALLSLSSSESPLDTHQRVALATKFAVSGYSSAALTSSAGFSPEARASMLRCVGACASSLVQHVAGGCFEDGALMARLWNLQTQIMQAEITSSHTQCRKLSSDMKGLNDHVKRLDPLIDWDKESRDKIETQRDKLETTSNSLILAQAERDALLRENDKIIAHYRKELKTFKLQQRKNAYRVARKLKITHQQMALMQQDRDQLVAAVTYTKDQALLLAKLVRMLHPKIKAVQKAMPDDSFEELEQIEAGLRNILATAEKVSEAGALAEQAHFDCEEQVTAVAATDRENDDILDAILAGGDPDFPNGEPTGDDDLAAMDFGAMDEDELSEAESDKEEEEDVAAAVSRKVDDVEGELDAEAIAAAEAAAADEEAASLASQVEDAEKERLAAAAANEEKEKLMSEAIEAATSAVSEKAKKKKKDKRSKGRGGDDGAEGGHNYGTASNPSSRPPSRLSNALMVSNQTQTDAMEAETVYVEVPVEVVKEVEAEKEPEPMYLVTASEQLLKHSANLKLSPPLKFDLKAIECGGSTGVGIFVESIVTSLKSYSSELEDRKAKVSELDKRVTQLADDVRSRDQSSKEVRAELVKVTQLHSKLVSSITAIGLDPQNPVLPKPPPPQKVYIEVPSGEVPEGAEVGDAGDATAGSPTKGKKEPGGKKKAKSAAARNPSPKREPPAVTVAPKEEKKDKPDTNDNDDASKTARVKAPSPPRRTASPSKRDAAAQKIREEKEMQQKVQSKTLAEAPVLGRDREVEKKEHKTGMQRLEDAVTKYADAKPRTLDWLIKLIDAMYRGKAVSDEQRLKTGQEPMAMVDYMFQHLAGVYGTRDLVNQYCAQIVATIEQFRATDARIVTFQRFIMEEWNRKILGVYIEGLKRLMEPARVPCCDFPADYTGTGGVRKGVAPTLVDVRKCLAVADKVLMKRTNQASYSFAAALAVKGEPISETEQGIYFMAPGYYGPDIANMRAYERNRAEFRSVTVNIFLDALCEEFLRCEQVMLDALPALFKKFDHDEDGYLQPQDIEPVFENMAPQGMEIEETEQRAAEFWKLLLVKENDSPGGDQLSHIDHEDASNMAGYRAFMEASMQTDFIRAYIRLYKTPAAKVKLDNSSEDLARMLTSIMIKRHWSLHGRQLCGLFKDMGASAVQLKQQVVTMERETDGNRMAIILHSLLKTIINRKLDLVVAQMSMDQVSTTNEFEDNLMRITNAAKVLYGADCLLANDIINMEVIAGTITKYEQRRAFQRWQADVVRIFNKVSDHMPAFMIHFLKTHPAMIRLMEVVSKRRVRGPLEDDSMSAIPASSTASPPPSEAGEGDEQNALAQSGMDGGALSP